MPSLFHNARFFFKKARQYLRESVDMEPGHTQPLRAKYAHECFDAFGIEVTGPTPEEIAKIPPCIYVANHTSTLDALIVCTFFQGDLRILAKDTLFKVPRLGKILRLEKHIMVHRGKNAHERNASIRDDVKKAIEEGASVLVFPEGTRSKDGKLGTFKRGAFFNAVQAKVPIVPIIIRGTFEAMPKSTLSIKEVPCSLEILDPIPLPDESVGDQDARVNDLMKRTHEVMAAKLGN